MQAGSLTMRVPPASAGTAMASIPVHRLQIARKPLAKTNCREATVDHVSYLGPSSRSRCASATPSGNHQPLVASRRSLARRRCRPCRHGTQTTSVLIPAQRG